MIQIFPIIKQFIAVTVFVVNYSAGLAQSIWTVGPMCHVNIGGDKVRASWALEFAYWNFNHFPYSIDFATEFEKQKIRIYTEAQTGIGIAGLALGPVLEIQTTNSAVKMGIQGSLWGNYYLGGDLRFRRIDKTTFFSPGVYLKGGFAPRDENGNTIGGSSYHGTYSHHDHHH